MSSSDLHAKLKHGCYNYNIDVHTLMIDYFLETDSRHLRTHQQPADHPLQTGQILILGNGTYFF